MDICPSSENCNNGNVENVWGKLIKRKIDEIQWFYKAKKKKKPLKNEKQLNEHGFT